MASLSTAVLTYAAELDLKLNPAFRFPDDLPNQPEAIASFSHDWSADQWARGAYCYFGPGDLNRFNPHLMLPAGRVFNACEHTAKVEYRGYMEGAIRSGQRAAQQILAS